MSDEIDALKSKIQYLERESANFAARLAQAELDNESLIRCSFVALKHNVIRMLSP